MAVYKVYFTADIREKPTYAPKTWTKANIKNLLWDNEPNGHFNLDRICFW